MSDCLETYTTFVRDGFSNLCFPAGLEIILSGFVTIVICTMPEGLLDAKRRSSTSTCIGRYNAIVSCASYRYAPTLPHFEVCGSQTFCYFIEKLRCFRRCRDQKIIEYYLIWYMSRLK